MVALDKDTLVIILSEHEGVDLVSYGRPRDGFELPHMVPHWMSGFGGAHEIVHTHVPAGAMIAVGDLDALNIGDLNALKEQLCKIDIYPTGHSGDFTGKEVAQLQKWFFDRSVRDDAVNNQDPIAGAKTLTPEGLGAAQYETLVDDLADGMQLFKDPKNGQALVPQDRAERVEIVKALLEGLSQSVRYTRLDGPAKGYQFASTLDVEQPGAGTLSFHLEEVRKIIVLRTDPKTGNVSVTPLNREMIGKTYVTQDGQPLGDRGVVDIATILKRAEEIEAARAAEGKPGFLKDILTGGDNGNLGTARA